MELGISDTVVYASILITRSLLPPLHPEIAKPHNMEPGSLEPLATTIGLGFGVRKTRFCGGRWTVYDFGALMTESTNDMMNFD